MHNRSGVASELLSFIRENPGSTASEIHNNFAHKFLKTTISGTLVRLRHGGLITNAASGRYSKYYPVEFETIDQKFLDIAHQMMNEIRLIPMADREYYIARKLQETVDTYISRD